MTLKNVLLLFLLAGCAAGPRPVPANADERSRLSMAEEALLNGNKLTATFELDSRGANAAHMTGTLELIDGNAIHLVAEGNFKSEPVQIELDSRDSSGINRSTTKGASVSSHRDPPASKLRQALAVGLARMGLLHNLVTLALDKPIEKLEGGIDEWVKAIEVKSGAAESINGEPCRRVESVVQVEGQRMGESSLCISDATALPLQRNLTVHFPEGDMTLVETFKWQQK
jgi:hypothetical protein